MLLPNTPALVAITTSELSDPPPLGTWSKPGPSFNGLPGVCGIGTGSPGKTKVDMGRPGGGWKNQRAVDGDTEGDRRYRHTSHGTGVPFRDATVLAFVARISMMITKIGQRRVQVLS